MHSFMKPGTKYITIIRNPITQFESAFSHFHFRDVFDKVDTKDKIDTEIPKTSQQEVFEFLKQPEIYHERLRHVKWEGVMALRWYYAKNNQMFDLGLDHNFHLNKTITLSYIDTLDREFDMVLLTEYIDESLVIMRRQFCWSWDDILYISKNRRPHKTKISQSLATKIKAWNPLDVLLYKHFNQTLWRKISQYGGDFQSDLAFYRSLRHQVFNECIQKQFSTVNDIWNRIKQVLRQGASQDCNLLVMSKKELFDLVWKRQYPKPPPKMTNNGTTSSVNASHTPRTYRNKKKIVKGNSRV
ncbi:galactosylceramide sulfotransferase-like [Antedon mediterranea]|uniref:galactosylceramide sulfotransferase-like n=1 Tax=Antedon mediterranea TaxID=105859 RepID=UPI003AF6BAA9